MQTKRRQYIRILSPLYISPFQAFHLHLCQICLDLAQVSAFVIVFVLALFFCLVMHIGLVALVVFSIFAIAALAYFQICCLFCHPAIVVLSFFSLLLHWPTFTFAFTSYLTLAEFFFSHEWAHLVILTLFTLAALQCVCHSVIFT